MCGIMKQGLHECLECSLHLWESKWSYVARTKHAVGQISCLINHLCHLVQVVFGNHWTVACFVILAWHREFFLMLLLVIINFIMTIFVNIWEFIRVKEIKTSLLWWSAVIRGRLAQRLLFLLNVNFAFLSHDHVWAYAMCKYQVKV